VKDGATAAGEVLQLWLQWEILTSIRKGQWVYEMMVIANTYRIPIISPAATTEPSLHSSGEAAFVSLLDAG
jgi:hypothetical protein